MSNTTTPDELAARDEALARLVDFSDVPLRVEELYAARARAIQAAVAAGATVSEVAERLGVNRKIVYDALG